MERLEVLELFKNSPPHIYFIVKRPRIFFDPTTLKVDEQFLTINYKVQKRDSFVSHELKLKNSLGTHNVRFQCDYPHTHFTIYDNRSGEILSEGEVSLFLLENFYLIGDMDLVNTEVLYVGQAFGKDGSRSAMDRLQSHSTLQMIYSEAIRLNPDSEIWIVLAAFDQFNITVFDGRTKFTAEELELDEETYEERNHKLNYEGINEQQKITFTEAALIKYFQPKYNKEYKDTFPNPAHSSYAECYELDVNSVGFELDTSDKIFCYLYSDAIAPSPVHNVSYLLHSPSERKQFFEIF